ALGGFDRLVRILVATRSFEDVAAFDFLSAEIAGLSGDTAQLVEFVVVRLEFIVGDGPILNRHRRRDSFAAVPFSDGALDPKIRLKVSPVQPAPVVSRTTHALAG